MRRQICGDWPERYYAKYLARELSLQEQLRERLREVSRPTPFDLAVNQVPANHSNDYHAGCGGRFGKEHQPPYGIGGVFPISRVYTVKAPRW